jgi:uncharacterized membrane protein
MDRAFWTHVFLFVHVMGAIAALGPTLTYAMWMALAERSDPKTRSFVLRSISWLDSRLPTPAYIAQAVTGVVLIALLGLPFFKTGWLVVGVSIYVVLVILAIAVYAPAFQRQLALADAIASDPAGATAAADYRAAARTSRIIGATVGGLTVLVVFFMVWKPNLW